MMQCPKCRSVFKEWSLFRNHIINQHHDDDQQKSFEGDSNFSAVTSRKLEKRKADVESKTKKQKRKAALISQTSDDTKKKKTIRKKSLISKPNKLKLVKKPKKKVTVRPRIEDEFSEDEETRVKTPKKKFTTKHKYISKENSVKDSDDETQDTSDDEEIVIKKPKKKFTTEPTYIAEDDSDDHTFENYDSDDNISEDEEIVDKKPKKKLATPSEDSTEYETDEGDFEGFQKIDQQQARNTDDESSEQLRKLLKEKQHWLQDTVFKGKGYVTYTRRIDDLTPETILPILQKTHRWESFNLIASLGVLLKSNKTGEYRFFWPSIKNSLFDLQVVRVRNFSQFQQILKSYNENEVENRLANAAPGSEFEYIRPLNLEITIFISSFEEIPAIELFFCLAYEGEKRSVIKKAKQMYQLAYPNTNLKQFKGVDPRDKQELNRICHLFKKGLFIYTPKKAANGKSKTIYRCTTAGLDMFAPGEPDYEEVNLFVFNQRYSCITDCNRFNNEFFCDTCKTMYTTVRLLNQHNQKVHNPSKIKKTPKPLVGSFRVKLYLKQKLEKQGIPEFLLENIHFKYFMCYDIEACLLNKRSDCDILQATGEKDSYLLQKHETACIALTSNFSKTKIFNVSRYDSLGPVEVVDRFVRYTLKLSHKAEQLYLRDNEQLISFLEKMQRKAARQEKPMQVSRAENMLRQIYSYAKQTPLLGYNAARYDTQVLRYNGLFSILNKLDGPIKVIRKGGFIQIRTNRLLWLDAIKYLAGGFSLRKFVKAFAPETQECKSYFPYEAFDSLEKLKNNIFPLYSMFESRLNGCNTLEEESRPYNELLENGFTTEEACEELKLEKPPSTGHEIYLNLKKIWDEQKMTTWRDLLNYYVNLDVVPFKKALGNLVKYFHDKDVDVLKAHCSLPSAAVKMLFQSAEADNHKPFLFLDQENYDHIRRTTHGGLVLCSQRLCDCSAGMKIKEYKYGELAELAKVIVSYDFNNLYGGTMGVISHLTGPYVQRDLEGEYSIKWCYENSSKNVKNRGCYTWLTAVAMAYEDTRGKRLSIKSAYNTGEKWIVTNAGNRYAVDGYVTKQPHNGRPLVLEYLGCMYHAHPNGECLGKGYPADELHPLQKVFNRKVFGDTQKRLQEIRDSGFEIKIMWECAWQKILKELPEQANLISEHLIPGLGETINISTEKQMLEGILNEKVYGVVFCSVTVPEHLKDTVYEYPPIFKKVTDYSLEKLPDDSYIKQYCLKHNLKPGKSFLSSFLSGDDLVLPTEVVRHYLQQGYIVKNVRRVLQFGNDGIRPFKKFVDEMVSERREGAAKGNSVVANMSKLILNAAVGFTLMKSNLLPKTLICDTKKAAKVRRLRPQITGYEFLGPSPQVKEFYEDEELDDMFLITTEKKNPQPISSMPILLGWKVLAMAKLQMLRFMEDARRYFVDSKWSFLYSDTDSVVCALAGKDIDDCIHDAYKKEWETKKRDIFVTNEPGICDNYTPLRLKIEATGDKFACISAKMYCIAGVNDHIIKSAQKGVKLALNRNLISYEKYKRIILEMGEPPTNSKHVGFLSSYRDDGFWTVQNEKRSFTGLYFKRLVLKDGYSTQPLDWND